MFSGYRRHQSKVIICETACRICDGIFTATAATTAEATAAVASEEGAAKQHPQKVLQLEYA